MKFSTFLLAISAIFTSALYAKDATFAITADSVNEVKVNNKVIKFDGELKKINNNTLMAFGAKGYSFPVQKLIGSKGTIVFEFALANPMIRSKSPARSLAILRFNGREEIGFYTFFNNRKLQYRFANQRQNFYGASEAIIPGKVYHAAFSWDGDRIRCYFNGKLIQEREQPFKVTDEKVTNFNIGPYKDRWHSTHVWNDDTLFKSLRLYNRALSNEEIAALAGVKKKSVRERYNRVITVPQRTAVNENGTSFVSLTSLTAPDKTWELPKHKASFAYDSKNLYVNFNTIFPPKTTILKGHSASDPKSGVWGFESFELHLRHSGKMYYFGGTVNGGKTDKLKNFNNFNPEWDYKSHIGMQIDDTFLWEGKIVLPWKAIGLNAPPKELKMNFCRSFFNSHITAATDLAFYTGRGGYWAPDEYFYTLKFEKNAPSVNLTGKDNPSYGNLEQEFEFYSPVDQTIKFEIIQESEAGLIQPQSLISKTINLKANQTYKFKAQSAMTVLQADRLVYVMTDAKKRKTFFCQDIPLKISAEYLTLKPLFYADKIETNVKTAILKSKFGSKAKITLNLKNPKGKILFTTSNITDKINIPFKKDYPAGSYLVEIVNNKKEILSAKSFVFPGYGEWNKMKYDMTRILPPYTAMEYDNGSKFTAKVINRTYTWDKDSLLPIQITSTKNDKLLAAPAAILVNGKEVKGAFKNTSALKHRAEMTASAQNADCKITSNGWIEYDGVNHNIVEFTALKNISDIQLKFVMPAKFAKYLHTSACGWGNKITDTVKIGKRSFKYFPVVFLGNEEKGLCFFAESNRNWKNSSPQPFSVISDGKETILLVNIAKKLKAGQKITFDYGLLATPVKPLHKHHPLNTAGWFFNVKMNRPGKTPTVWTSYLDYHGIHLADAFADVPGAENDRIVKKVKNDVATSRKFNVKPFPYNPHYVSDEYPEMKAFSIEWDTVPRQLWNGKRNGKPHTLSLLCPASKGADFFLYRAKKYIEKTGIDGVNFDFGIIPECDNHNHGCYNRTPLIAYRNFFRKLAMILIDAGAKDQDYVIHVHNTASVQIPSYTFVTHLLNGEHIRQQSSTLMHNGKDILDTYPLAMFANELSSLPFGINNAAYQANDILTKQFGGGKEDPELYKLRITRAFMAGMVIHNSLPSLDRCHFGIFDKLVRIYSAFEVPSCEFIGYWDERKAAQVTVGKDVYASLYKHPTENKILAVISHVGNKRLDQDVTVKIDPAVLNMKDFKSAAELFEADDPDYAVLFEKRKETKIPAHRNPLKWQNPGIKLLDFKDNTVKLHLPAHTFAVIELK